MRLRTIRSLADTLPLFVFAGSMAFFGCGGGDGQTDLGDADEADASKLIDSDPGLFLDALDGGGCGKQTCASAGANCGPVADGCGGLIADCGTCTGDNVCGGGGTASVCGNSLLADGGKGCIPQTCTDAGANCGPIGDGCGGVVNCGTCTVSGESCGGGGTPSVCGVRFIGSDGGFTDGSTCTLRKCSDVAANCGPIADGCGGLLDCGTCTSPDICGGSGKPNICGNSFAVDGSACLPKACKDFGATCGPIGDGCGGVVASCGTCASPAICGGGGTPSVCGDSFASPDGGACSPRSCKDVGANCGPIGDGCGGVIASCGTCTSPAICGGGGIPSVCGDSFASPDGGACTPRKCSDVGATCGAIADGCGGIIGCGTCASPDICGGGGKPNVCGGGTGDGGPTCTGLACKVVTCPTAGVSTTISGTVYAPTPAKFGPPDPLYNAIVYIPNTAVAPFTSTKVTCDKCGSAVSGSPIVTAVTGPDGKFVLKGVPVGTNIPLVIQLGKWRRQIVIPTVTACVNTALTPDQTRLPRTHLEGDIPLMAISTGQVDTLECVLRKIGIDESEFSLPTGTGRVRMYTGNGATKVAGVAMPSETVLSTTLAEMEKYDMVLFPCWGTPTAKTAARQKNLIDYTGEGGRAFVTHYSYTWLYNDAPFSGTAAWKADQAHPTASDLAPLTGILDVSFPKGKAFQLWTDIVKASAAPGSGTINITYSRHDLDGVVPPSQRWIYSAAPSVATIQHYTFNTPVGTPAADQCGRVVYSDFHVNNIGSSSGLSFPDGKYCADTPMSAQEKVLEFMLFDLASCVTSDSTPPPPPPTCSPITCTAAGASCGPAGDGCGGVIDCGSCGPGLICGGGGAASTCGGPTCKPTTCTTLGTECGPAGDGCGGLLDCGTCKTPGKTCGGGGLPGICGGPVCTATTCSTLGVTCGPAGDGCGGLLDCGTCTAPGESCGGGGIAGKCGGPKCTPTTCAAQGFTCGPAGDGCGGKLDCGTCTTAGDTCGGGGIAGVCGHSDAAPCTPRTCTDIGLKCGPAGDGCGGLLDCGKCTVAGESCGGGGVPGVCGGPKCTPRTCASVGATCGPLGDGCGGVLDCGKCVAPQSCGGGGTASVCGGGTR